ncbi:hypothetical protein [Terrimonas ferruginea]|uniref:DUF7738 domain-containing protein n=1 Tax=Terrimonas ferruginea TaxID=249 RepID=UPI000429C43F|nr:hypothetical protein [Terrimonas ferruginea]
MKRFLLILFVLISGVAAGQSRELNFKLTKLTFSINKEAIGAGWPLESFTSAIGAGARTRDGYNRTHSYDDLGIVLFEPSGKEGYSGQVSEIQLYFQSMERKEVTPKGLFAGSFTIDRLSLNAQTTLTMIREALKGFDESKGYEDSIVRMARGDYYLYFHFKEDGTLGKMSMGLVKSK